MPDMTKFIIGKDKKPKASLEGLVVTPYFQKFGRNENDGFSIKEIVQSKDFLYRFDPNEFPSIEITGCGEIFFTPVKKVITTTESYFIKWFSLTREFKIQHDHAYNYARLAKDGYLMKCVVTPLNVKAKDFELCYVTPVDCVEVVDNDDVPVMRALTSESENYVNTHNTELRVKKYTPGAYVKIDELLTTERSTFVEDYLHDLYYDEYDNPIE